MSRVCGKCLSNYSFVSSLFCVFLFSQIVFGQHEDHLFKTEFYRDLIKSSPIAQALHNKIVMNSACSLLLIDNGLVASETVSDNNIISSGVLWVFEGRVRWIKLMYKTLSNGQENHMLLRLLAQHALNYRESMNSGIEFMPIRNPVLVCRNNGKCDMQPEFVFLFSNEAQRTSFQFDQINLEYFYDLFGFLLGIRESMIEELQKGYLSGGVILVYLKVYVNFVNEIEKMFKNDDHFFELKKLEVIKFLLQKWDDIHLLNVRHIEKLVEPRFRNRNEFINKLFEYEQAKEKLSKQLSKN